MVECYLFGPLGQPGLVVTLPGQLRPEERAEVVNVQRGFLDSFALDLGLDAIDKAIDVATSRGRRRILLLTLGPQQNQMSIEVDDLVVQPLVGPETSNVPVCDLLSTGLGYRATLCENCIDIGLVLRWEMRG